LKEDDDEDFSSLPCVLTCPARLELLAFIIHTMRATCLSQLFHEQHIVFSLDISMRTRISQSLRSLATDWTKGVRVPAWRSYFTHRHDTKSPCTHPHSQPLDPEVKRLKFPIHLYQVPKKRRRRSLP